jgi:hypothetical protein
MELTVDNGTQFDSEAFKEFCMQMGTKICSASVRHPQSNGLVKRANGIILQGIYKRLHGRPKGKWVKELTSVIWSHNTSKSRATKFTPFKLLFREEAVLLEELTHKSPRVTLASNKVEAQEDEQLTKDLIEEVRCQAVNNLCLYQDETIRWRNKKVNPRQIITGDMVLIRKQNTKMAVKLQPKWLGPYLATQTTRQGAFTLQDSEGNKLPHTWNIDDLRKFYP